MSDTASANMWVEVRVRWWVRWMMNMACMVAWCLRGKARLWWIGWIFHRMVPWISKHGVLVGQVSPLKKDLS